ncbi:MAG: LysM peptidoglycan-binding protein [Blastococcus sp.]|nr:LysM peptidoglycan-binding protein [Blastococcus sp.]
MVRLIEVRQPRPHDVIGRTFTIAGFGTGFEATVIWRVLGRNASVLGQGRVQGVGSMGVLHDFGHDVTLTTTSAHAATVTLQVFGDDPSGQHRPGPDLDEVPAVLFGGLTGWRLHEVVRGDNLTKIARDHGENTTVDDVFAANRDILTDPNLIRPGQILRIPLL